MPCPDELTLDLWLAGALPASETDGLADHLADCPLCHASIQASRRTDRALSAALALEAEDLAYLDSFNLVGRWRPAGPAAWWYWLVFLGTLASFATWSLASPLVRPALELVARTGLGVILARGLFETLLRVGEAMRVLATSPLLGYSLPLLALLALILVAWPGPARMAPVRT